MFLLKLSTGLAGGWACGNLVDKVLIQIHMKSRRMPAFFGEYLWTNAA
jgi:hypothetical protein